MKKLLFIAALLIIQGCQSCPEKAILREGMYSGVRTERQFAKDTAAKLVIGADGVDHRGEIPALTPAQYQNLLLTDQAFEDLVNTDRTHDTMGK